MPRKRDADRETITTAAPAAPASDRAEAVKTAPTYDAFGASDTESSAETMKRVARDIDALVPRELTHTAKLQLILSLAQGARTMFDQKTHRQVRQVYNRFSYVFLIAKLLEGSQSRDLVGRVLDHLDEAQEALQMA